MILLLKLITYLTNFCFIFIVTQHSELDTFHDEEIAEDGEDTNDREEPASIETWKPTDKLIIDLNSQEKMKELIERVAHKRIDLIYSEKELFHLFMRVCTQQIIGKRKWTTCSITQRYYEYVTVSDEAFAFLVLENNGKRYLDMANTAVEKIDWSNPKYTDVSQKGAQKRELQTRGWTSEGKMRYMAIYKEINEYRYNEEKFDTEKKEDLAKYIIEREMEAKRARKQLKKRTTIVETDGGEDVNLMEQLNIWDNFMKQTSETNVRKRSNGNHDTASSICIDEDNNNVNEDIGRHRKRKRKSGKRNRMAAV